MGTLPKKRICFLKNKRTRLINKLIDMYTYAYHLEDNGPKKLKYWFKALLAAGLIKQ